MRYVLHVDDEVVSDIIVNSLIVVPPGKAVRIENDFIAETFMNHKASIHGLVYVDEVDGGDSGYRLDVASARERAAVALEEAEKRVITEYIETQQQDRIRINFPALPPAGRTAKVIAKRGVDLFTFGIKPVGYQVERQQAMSGNEALAARITELENQLRETLQAQQQLLAALAPQAQVEEAGSESEIPLASRAGGSRRGH